MHEAARIIKDEHAALAAILHALRHVARDCAVRGMTPDFTVLRAMLDYIVAFPEKLHHPKEDQYLFGAMRARSPEAGAILDQSQAEHVQCDEMIKQLQEALLAYQKIGSVGASAFRAAVEAYCNFQWAHMRREEEAVLPLAEKILTESDWQELARVFKENDDPLFGLRPKDEMDELFQRIVNITPAPIGVGPEKRKAV